MDKQTTTDVEILLKKLQECVDWTQQHISEGDGDKALFDVRDALLAATGLIDRLVVSNTAVTTMITTLSVEAIENAVKLDTLRDLLLESGTLENERVNEVYQRKINEVANQVEKRVSGTPSQVQSDQSS